MMPDLSTEHYAWLWKVQLDGPAGEWIPQLDHTNAERSLSKLPWDRVTRLVLEPQRPGLPTLDLRVDLGKGERAFKYWQCWRFEMQEEPSVRQVLGVEMNGLRFYVLAEPANRVIIASTPDIGEAPSSY